MVSWILSFFVSVSLAQKKQLAIGEATGPCLNGRIHLTFDDGPNENSLRILEVLQKHQVPATFFVVLKRLENPANVRILKTLKENGMSIGLHGYTHDDFTDRKTSVERQFVAMDQVLQQKIGNQRVEDFVSPVLRLPYGAGWRAEKRNLANDPTRRILRQLEIRQWSHFGWHIDSEDYKATSQLHANALALKTIEKVKTDRGGVVLFHDINSYTPQALDIFISKLKKEFCFVDLPGYVVDRSLKINLQVGSRKLCR